MEVEWVVRSYFSTCVGEFHICYFSVETLNPKHSADTARQVTGITGLFLQPVLQRCWTVNDPRIGTELCWVCAVSWSPQIREELLLGKHCFGWMPGLQKVITEGQQSFSSGTSPLSKLCAILGVLSAMSFYWWQQMKSLFCLSLRQWLLTPWNGQLGRRGTWDKYH